MGGVLLGLLSEGPRLIVSLPRNSPELARAAADGGADALKVHLNVTHQASGTHFGSLREEREALEAVLAVGLPTGIVPGTGERLPSREEMCELAAMGFDFFDLFARDMPAWMASFDGMTRTAAVDRGFPLDSVPELAALGLEMIEAAVVPPEGYGRPVSIGDIAIYRRLRRVTELPIIVPTERAIQLEDVPALIEEVGVNAIMIGAVVTGREAQPLRGAAKGFAAAISAIRD